MPYKSFLVLLLTLFHGDIFAQYTQNQAVKLDWREYGENSLEETGYQHFERPLWCSSCQESIQNGFYIPIYSTQISLGNQSIKSVRIVPLEIQSFNSIEMGSILSSDFEVEFQELTIEGKRRGIVNVKPLRNFNNKIETLNQFEIQIEFEPRTQVSFKNKKDQTYTSVLEAGDSYKISVAQSGVYRIDKNFFNSNNIDITDLRLSTFNIYGNGGAMLPEVIADPRAEDLNQNALYVIDQNSNDILDNDDYILWYAQGPHGLNYNTTSGDFNYSKNDFEDKAYYFLQWGNENTLSINSRNANQSTFPDKTVDRYNYFLHHEEDDINHIHSGRIWWGDEMAGSQTIKNFTYSVPGLISGENLKFKSVTSARSLITSVIAITVNGVQSNSVHGQVSGEFDANYTAGNKTSVINANVSSSTLSVKFDYSNKPLNDSKAWIDYFDITAWRDLEIFNDQQSIRSTEGLFNGNVKYSIDNLGSHMIWDVTIPTRPVLQESFTDGGSESFVVNSTDQELIDFHLFDPSKSFNPLYVEKVPTQNLHGLSDVEYIIITHPDFLEDAERLAQFHRIYSGLVVEVVNVFHVYNEFSSGSQDITAIRDFVKLIYDRGQSGVPLKYLLLFGDASYDPKNRIENNTNYVPIYQSFNSYMPAASHCSDDYYAILDDDEGYWGLAPRFEGLDIGVGRLPVSSTAEAKLMVDKIIHYHDGSFGNWVNKLSFLGDDEDNNIHFLCSEELTNTIGNQNPRYNINKIWMDAFEQVSFGSGNKYPDVNIAVDQAVNQGTLVFNYVGHGGTNGMSHERVVTRPQITEWINKDQLSFYITASCELAAVDNPAVKSPGELMLFNPNGGAIGMVATTRVVYIGANCDLNEDIMNNNIFNIINHHSKPLGDVYKDTRNRANTGQVINKRSFMLFADPAMGLLTPPHKVVPTQINGQNFSTFTDTITALSKVTIEGEIKDYNNVLMNGFNGILYPTIYDKPATFQTRGNDPKSYVADFDAQVSVIYKGKISVSNGLFSFSFVVPKDIAYQFGHGKLSFYADNGVEHAGGYNTDLIIGGTSDSLKDDQQFDSLELYIDDRSWIFGGMTSITPLLLVDLYDENGINTVGSGIGREMEGILDEGTENEQLIVLNEFFQPELNSYQSGTINYNFGELSPGRHTIRVKVWDVYNNSSEGYTEFVVGQGGGIQIDHLLNYPNPFNEFTTFHFDHNKSGQNLDLQLTILSITGEVIQQISTSVTNAEAHSTDLSWDGRDQFGDPIGRGVYLYQLQVRAEDGSTEKQTQKLYIIK